MSKQYILVTWSFYDGDFTLEEAVNRKINEGYAVLGPPIVVSGSSSQSIGLFKGLVNEETKYTYAQPMVRMEKTE